MRSEYDFLAPLSGPLRRAGTLAAAGCAFVAGMVCTGLVVALTMKPADEGQALFTTASERSVPAALTPKPAGAAQAAGANAGAAAAPVPPARPDEAKPKVATRSLAVERTETTGQSNAPPPVQAAERVQATAPTPAKPAEQTAAPEPQPQVATDGEAKPEKPRKRIKRARAPRSQARAQRQRGDEREATREYVDQFGRRTVILPRRWNDTDSRAWARERAYDRGPVFGPGPYYGR
jgi:hypothetical protein